MGNTDQGVNWVLILEEIYSCIEEDFWVELHVEGLYLRSRNISNRRGVRDQGRGRR